MTIAVTSSGNGFPRYRSLFVWGSRAVCPVYDRELDLPTYVLVLTAWVRIAELCSEYPVTQGNRKAPVRATSENESRTIFVGPFNTPDLPQKP